MPSTASSYEFRLYANNGFALLATSPVVAVVLTDPVIQVTPLSLAFGDVAPGSSATRTLTVKNAGAGTLSGSATVAGAAFSIAGAATYNLSAGQSATLGVAFAPSALGDFSSSVSLTGGGGASVALTGRGAAAPALAVSASQVGPGGSVQVTVENGPGNPLDWVALAPVGGSYLDWQYLSGSRTPPAAGLSSAVLTFSMPSTAGSYEFRLYANNGFALLATSPVVAVVLTDPVIQVTPLSLTFGDVAPGSSATRTLTVKNAGAGTLSGSAPVAGAAFSIAGAATYNLGAGQSATLSVAFAPSAVGNFSGTVSLTGGGAVSVPITGRGALAPSLSVSTTQASPGGSVQVTVQNGPGNRLDWVALAPVGGGYIDWRYLSGSRTPPAAGLSSAVLTFSMPSTPGSYEFRLYANDSFVLLATSPAVGVAP